MFYFISFIMICALFFVSIIIPGVVYAYIVFILPLHIVKTGKWIYNNVYWLTTIVALIFLLLLVPVS